MNTFGVEEKPLLPLAGDNARASLTSISDQFEVHLSLIC